MGSSFDTLPERHARLARLHAVLASPKREAYLLGIDVLYRLFTKERWILKQDYLGNLTNRLSTAFLDFSPDEDDSVLDTIVPEAEAEQDIVGDRFQAQARCIFHRLKRAGWFYERPDKIDGENKAILVVPAEAHELARYVSNYEILFAHGSGVSASSPCVYPAFSTLKAALDDYSKARGTSDDASNPTLDRPAVREAVARNLFNAVSFSIERASVLNDRIRGAIHEFWLLEERISKITCSAELLPLVSGEYRAKLLDGIMQPLRLEDGYDHYGRRIVRLLDAIIGDATAIDLLVEGAALMGEVESDLDARTDVQLLRYRFAKEIAEAWDFATTLDAEVSDLIMRKYRIVLGSNTSAEGSLARILMRMCDANEAVSALALETLCGCALLPPSDAFYDGDLPMPRVNREARPDHRVVINDSGSVKPASAESKPKPSPAFAAARGFRDKILRANGTLDNGSLALDGRRDRAQQMLYALAAHSPRSGYVVASVDDSKRIVRNGQNVPSVTFCAVTDRKETQDG